ncbi:divalent-cation tolerance protein CutA [Streptomyces xiangluensis]|uniref:Divalent-cation tolerance protein CutA n=1 Tax=Streptomyces xiangluensis TaxID=2665720 RepID=A0ABV8YX49_9ACTN
MTDVCSVVITAPDPEWLASFVEGLVSDRLCASGHIVEQIRSIYRWQGDVHDATEGHVTLHTRPERVAEIIARTERDHPYEVPCVISTPIADASPAYRAWIIEQTTTG